MREYKARSRIFFLIFVISFLSLILVYFLNRVGLIQVSDVLSFAFEENPKIIQDTEYPLEVEKLELEKEKQRLLEQEERLAMKEIDLENKENLLEQQLQEIKEVRKGIQEERKRLTLIARDLQDRKEKVRDLASKVRNMPPEKAVEMMENWKHFDIIEVIRQIDSDSDREGVPSITPFLLTLFSPEERAEITRKMLLQPVELNTQDDPR